MLLAFCSAHHPHRFDMPNDHVWKKNWPPGHPKSPQSPTTGAWPRRQNKNPVWYVMCLSFVRTHTKFGIKNLWNWHGNRNLMKFVLWPHTKVTSFTLGWKFYLHSVLLVIPVDLICHMTMFEKNKFLTTWAPPVPKSLTPVMWHFIWVCTVCQTTNLGVSSIQWVKLR